MNSLVELIAEKVNIDNSRAIHTEKPTNDFVPPSTYKYKENSNTDLEHIRDNTSHEKCQQ